MSSRCGSQFNAIGLLIFSKLILLYYPKISQIIRILFYIVSLIILN